MASVKKVSQKDLRMLMSLQKRKILESSKRIESPLAKYSSSGVLSCIVCESIVRSEAVWNVHINSKQHKDNIARKKSPAAPTPPQHQFLPPAVPKVPGKRRHPGISHDSGGAAPPKKIKGILKNAPPVPDGFFDDVIISSNKAPEPDGSSRIEANGAAEPMDEDEDEEGLEETSSGSKKEAPEIPEGFFDNPKEDAKARNVEYKDPIQEEWERFQKEIKEETTVSAQIIHDDTEDATAQRQIEEIDEQLRKLSKVVELDHKREKVKADVLSKPKTIKEEEMSEGEDEDFELEFDWRAKSFLS